MGRIGKDDATGMQVERVNFDEAHRNDGRGLLAGRRWGWSEGCGDSATHLGIEETW